MVGALGAAIEEHHERFDGLGYPRGLAGHEIALAGRVVAVADVFEVLTAARSYKRPMSVRAARRELASVAGTQLDPQCVRALLSASLPRVLWVVGPLSLLVNLPFLRSVADVGRVVEQAGASAASQATTAAVAATAAVAVVAAPGVSAAEPPHPQPHRSAPVVQLGSASPGHRHAAGPRRPLRRAAPTRSPDPTERRSPDPIHLPRATRATLPGVPTTSPSPTPSGRRRRSRRHPTPDLERRFVG